VSVVTHILSTPNVTEQRDGRRDTPLMLARKRGLAAVEQALLQAGANDLPSSSPSAGRTAWCAGMSPVYIANATNVGAPSSDCGNMTPCDQVPDYSYLHTSRKSIDVAASVTCLVLFPHLEACLQSFGCVLAGQQRPYSSHTQPARNEPSSSRSYGRSLHYTAPAVQKPPGLSKPVLPDRPPGFP